jgi:hypothetical protein
MDNELYSFSLALHGNDLNAMIPWLCNFWAQHYNFLVDLPIFEEYEQEWFRQQYNFNKIYDC